jgi:hypothetical protein
VHTRQFSFDAILYLAKNANMDAKISQTDQELEEAIRLVLSGNKHSEELKRARERGDEFRRQMRAKYGPRNIAVELVQKARDGE